MADTGMQLKWDRFDDYTRDLAKRSGASLPHVIESEVARILEVAAKKTRKATRRTIKESQQSRKWIRIRGKWYNLNNRYPDKMHRIIQSHLKKQVTARAKRAGLASAAFMDIADRMGQPVPRMPAKTRKASRPAGWDVLSRVSRSQDPRRFFVDVGHSGSVLRWAGASQALFSAVAGRIKFFETNLKKGAFDTAKSTSAAYPGITVTRGR